MTKPEARGCGHHAGSAHPIDDLSAEHRAIETLLDALEQEASRLAAGGALRREWLTEAVTLLQEFADRCHHGKEEGLLFPELGRHGLSCDHGPIPVLTGEHDQGRALIEQLWRANERGNRPEITGTIAAYAGLMRQHIQKEDQILFPLARVTLPGLAVARLRTDFDAFEREVMGAGRHCQHLERVRKLGAAADPAGSATTPAPAASRSEPSS